MGAGGRLIRAIGWAMPLALALVFAGVLAGRPASLAGLGEPAPAFALRPFTGQRVTSETLWGRPTLLHFWSSWSGLAGAEAAMMERLWQEYRGRGVAFVGIAVFDTDPTARDPEHNARAFAGRHRLTYPNGLDAGDEIGVRYRVADIPERYFIDAGGRIVRRHAGPMDEAALRRALDELLGDDAGRRAIPLPALAPRLHVQPDGRTGEALLAIPAPVATAGVAVMV